MIELERIPETVGTLVFAPDGSSLATCSHRHLYKWDFATGSLASVPLDGRTFFAWSLAYTPDSRFMVLACDGWLPRGPDPSACGFRAFAADTLQLLDTPLADPVVPYFHRDALHSPTEPMIVFISGHTIEARSTLDGTIRWSKLNPSLASYFPSCFSDDGEHLLVSDRKSITIFDPATGEARRQFPCEFLGNHTYFRVSPGLRYLSMLDGMYLHVYDIERGGRVARLQTRHPDFTGHAFHPDGRTLFTSSNDGTVRLWDTTTWKEISAFDWKVGKLRAMAMDRQGMRVAAGTPRGRVIVWDL